MKSFSQIFCTSILSAALIISPAMMANASVSSSGTSSSQVSVAQAQYDWVASTKQGVVRADFNDVIAAGQVNLYVGRVNRTKTVQIKVLSSGGSYSSERYRVNSQGHIRVQLPATLDAGQYRITVKVLNKNSAKYIGWVGLNCIEGAGASDDDVAVVRS